MRIIAFIGILFLLSLHSNGQDWFEGKAQWHYGSIKFDPVSGYYNSYCHMNALRDTVVQGKDCYILTKNCYPCDCLGLEVILHEENGVVQIFHNDSLEFDTLFNMNINPGESWSFTPNESISSDTVKVNVTGNGQKIINGDTLKYIVVNTTGNNWFWGVDTIVEKIGPLHAYFFPQYFACDPLNGNLRCYSDDSLGLFETGIVPYCTYEDVGINEFWSNLNIYPNPAQDYLIIENLPMENCRISIRNVLGQEVYASYSLGLSEKTLNTSNLKAGIYVLEVQTANSEFSRRLVIE
ncbi:MAG: T9SS type A sorting domain-containing protein [Bacteroidales bacterium]|nr:T9SS type A sorting domain-containing protein [Bacteroidales bacterium]